MLKTFGSICAAVIVAAAAFSTPVQAQHRGGAHVSGARVSGVHSGARVGGAHFGGVRVASQERNHIIDDKILTYRTKIFCAC